MWSPWLAVRTSRAWPLPWLPVLSFWQATADTMAATSVPDGQGHRYADEIADGWDQVMTSHGEL
jgi:uncharacterized membrane protein